VLRIAWFDPSDVAAGSELVARAEAEALIARMGANVTWRRAASGEMTRSEEVWVILLGSGGQPVSGPLVLGATRRHHPVAPVVWVRVANVRAALGISQRPPLRDLPPIERRLFAIALGRVIAHEVVHALVPSLPHGTGLMSGSFSRRQLTGGWIPIEPEVVFALRAALRGDPVVAPAGTQGLAAQAQVQEKDR
jgi:hypothetical protein